MKHFTLILIFNLLAIALPCRAQTSQSPQRVPTVPREGNLGSANELALVTTPIQMFCKDTLVGKATGFFFTTPGESQMFLITNRHVVVEEKEQLFPDHLVIRLHTDASNLKESQPYTIPLYREISGPPATKSKLWREANPQTDVVAIELNTLDMKRFVFHAFNKDFLIPSDIELGLGDPLVIIGYPLGFSDQLFNLPVAREGTVASVFPVPFQGQRYFLVDARLHPGTSGSPVITRPSNYFVENGTPTFSDKPVVFLVGIQSAAAADLNLNAVWFADIILDLIK